MISDRRTVNKLRIATRCLQLSCHFISSKNGKNYNGRVFCSYLLGFYAETITFILGKTSDIVMTIGFHQDQLKDILAACELVE